MADINSLDARWLREDARDEDEYQGFLARRMAGEPVHRILGWREFWGMKFFLSPETLEPRPDSETMIEVLLSSRAEAAKAAGDPGSREGLVPSPSRDPGSSLRYARDDSLRILDLGTGTGCLLLAALSEFKNATGIGIDQSANAIATAQKNAAHHQLNNRAEFLQLDWNDEQQFRSLGRFDIILCNPPYIPSKDIETLSPEVKHHDPIKALDGGDDGLDPYRYLAKQLPYLLNPNGIALFEFGYDQAAHIQQIMQSHAYQISPIYKDLGGNDRIIIVSTVQK